MKTLDLHNLRHPHAGDAIRDFLNFAELPVRIVTGNSREMRSIASDVIREYEYEFYFENSYNFGALIVCETKH